MVSRRWIRAFLFVLLVAACLAPPAHAQKAASPSQAPAALQVTQKFDYKPVQQIQAIQFGLEKIQARQIVFAPASEAGGGKQHHSVPEAVLSLSNDGPTAAAVGIAIAIFDGDGNLIAAGSGGTRAGWLAPNEKETVAIRLPFVYRNLDKARTFMLTMELLPKPPKGEAAASN